MEWICARALAIWKIDTKTELIQDVSTSPFWASYCASPTISRSKPHAPQQNAHMSLHFKVSCLTENGKFINRLMTFTIQAATLRQLSLWPSHRTLTRSYS